MKIKSAFAVVLACVLVGAVAASYVGGTAGLSVENFSLWVGGRAYDPLHGKWVSISLSLRGTRTGKLSGTVVLHVSSGNVDVNRVGIFAVSRSSGTLVQGCHYISFTIKITSQYGGRGVVWYLEGRTGSLAGRTMPIWFYESRVTLPMSGYPQLKSLFLIGTLSLV